MLATISTILRAVFFWGVSNTQSTLSLPAPGWQSAQSKPKESAMTPIAPRKSSGVSSLSVLVVTFLKNVPAFNGAWPACAAAWFGQPNPINPETVTMATARPVCLDQNFIHYPSLGTYRKLAIMSQGRGRVKREALRDLAPRIGMLGPFFMTEPCISSENVVKILPFAAPIIRPSVYAFFIRAVPHLG